MWDSLAAVELWDLRAGWLHPECMPGPLSSPRRKPGSHRPRSEARRRGHLRQHLDPTPPTQPLSWPSNLRGSSPGMTNSCLPFCWRITPAWTQTASWIFLFREGFAKLGERQWERKMETGGHRCLQQSWLNRVVPVIANLSPNWLHKACSRICCLNCRCHYLFLMLPSQKMEEELKDKFESIH